jgi:site-specific recombinase XerD
MLKKADNVKFSGKRVKRQSANSNGDNYTAPHKIYYQACKAARVGYRQGIHSFRQAFATPLLEQRTDWLVIKRCLGHSALSTMAQYCHLTAEHLFKVRSPADVLFETR